jgi:NAD(P)-dependent dehydrogenase (short-subunit alcohol dehydrogenase family)
MADAACRWNFSVVLAAAAVPTDVAEFTRLWSINVVGTFNMSRAAAAMLTNDPDAERGVIVNTSSDAGEDGTTGMPGYAATKAALIGMTLPAAREFAGRGIRVNTIVAGGFDTPILDITGREAAASQIKFFANPRGWANPKNSRRFAHTSQRMASTTPAPPASTLVIESRYDLRQPTTTHQGARPVTSLSA